jgi:hypothetical protein
LEAGSGHVRHGFTDWRLLLTNRTLLANYWAFFVFGYFLFFFMTWLPNYLAQTYNLNVKEVGLYTILPGPAQQCFWCRTLVPSSTRTARTGRCSPRRLRRQRQREPMRGLPTESGRPNKGRSRKSRRIEVGYGELALGLRAIASITTYKISSRRPRQLVLPALKVPAHHENLRVDLR